MLSLTILTLSLYSSEIFSSSGRTVRQGPHHSAQKSTRSGTSDARTVSLKSCSPTSWKSATTCLSFGRALAFLFPEQRVKPYIPRWIRYGLTRRGRRGSGSTEFSRGRPMGPPYAADVGNRCDRRSLSATVQATLRLASFEGRQAPQSSLRRSVARSDPRPFPVQIGPLTASGPPSILSLM